MIIQIQQTAIMLLITALVIVHVSPEEIESRLFMALTLIFLFGSLATVIVTTLLRIWM